MTETHPCGEESRTAIDSLTHSAQSPPCPASPGPSFARFAAASIFLGRDLRALLACLGQADRDGLLGVGHLLLRLAAALELPFLHLVHGFLDFFLRFLAVLLRHDEFSGYSG